MSAADALMTNDVTNKTDNPEVTYKKKHCTDIAFSRYDFTIGEGGNTELFYVNRMDAETLIDYFQNGKYLEDIERNDVQFRKIATAQYYVFSGYKCVSETNRVAFFITTHITTALVVKDVRNAPWVFSESFRVSADVGRAYLLYGDILSREEIIAKALIEFPWEFKAVEKLFSKSFENADNLIEWAERKNYVVKIFEAYLAGYANNPMALACIEDLLISFELMKDLPIQEMFGKSEQLNFSWAVVPTEFGINVVMKFADGKKIDCMLIPKNN